MNVKSFSTCFNRNIGYYYIKLAFVGLI